MSWALQIDERTCGLRLRRARRWWSRLIGFWPSPRHHAVDVIEFPNCKAIHTFAMRAALDVVFVDREGRVLQVLSALPAWRTAFDQRAAAVFEFRGGVAQGLGIEPGSLLRTIRVGEVSADNCGASRRRRAVLRNRGSATLEFVFAVMLILLPLVTGILEFAQLAVSRHILGQATAEAARSAGINVMDAAGEIDTPSEVLAIRLSLARGLLPLLGGLRLESESLAATTLEVLRPDRLHVAIERNVAETADVIVDRVEVRYCREVFFAPASYLLPGLMRLWTVVPFDRLCLEGGRVPLRVSAPAMRSRFP